jgi:hypothetical protein
MGTDDTDPSWASSAKKEKVKYITNVGDIKAGL